LATQLGLSPEALVQTVTTYNAAVQDRPFDPTIKDGKGTQGIELAKANWALRHGFPCRCAALLPEDVDRLS
jgi:tricarballylate dehydrogenase